MAISNASVDIVYSPEPVPACLLVNIRDSHTILLSGEATEYYSNRQLNNISGPTTFICVPPRRGRTARATVVPRRKPLPIRLFPAHCYSNVAQMGLIVFRHNTIAPNAM